MDDVGGFFLGLPHSTTPAAVNKNIKVSSCESNGNIDDSKTDENLFVAYAKTKAHISSADQCLCFCYLDSTIPLLLKSEISSL